MDFRNHRAATPHDTLESKYTEVLAQYEQNKILLEKQKNRAEDLRRALVQLSNELKKEQQQNEHLKDKNESVTETEQLLKEASMTLKKREMEIEQLRQEKQLLDRMNDSKFDELTNDLSKIEEQHLHVLKAYEQLQQDNKALNEQVATVGSLQMELYDLNEQLHSKKQSLDELENTNRLLANQYSYILEQSSEKQVQYEEMIGQLSGELEIVEQEREGLKQQISQNHEQLQLLQNANETLEIEKQLHANRLEEELERVSKFNRSLRSTQQELDRQIEIGIQQKKQIVDLEHLQKQVESDRQQTLNELENKLAAQFEANESLLNANQLLHESQVEIEKRYEQQQQASQTLVQENEQLTVSLEQASKKINQFMFEKELHQQLEQRPELENLIEVRQELEKAKQEVVQVSEKNASLQQQLSLHNALAEQNHTSLHQEKEQIAVMTKQYQQLEQQLHQQVEMLQKLTAENKELKREKEKTNQFDEEKMALQRQLSEQVAINEQLVSEQHQFIPPFDEQLEQSIFEKFEQLPISSFEEDILADDDILFFDREEKEEVFRQQMLPLIKNEDFADQCSNFEQDGFHKLTEEALLELMEEEVLPELGVEDKLSELMEENISELLDDGDSPGIVDEQKAPDLIISPIAEETSEEMEEQIEQEKPRQSFQPLVEKLSSIIQSNIKDVLANEEKVTQNNYFRSDEDEHQYAKVVKNKVDSKRAKPKMLSLNMESRYEKIHQERKDIEISSTPYFARMDFKVGNENKVYYIGMHPIDGYVIPWQGRVAKAFYELDMGNSFEINRMTNGTLDYRRNIDMLNGKIVHLHKPETMEHQSNDAVVYRIENKRGKEMETIVDTIQKQQYEIISLPIELPVVVQGSAGSGKSAITLHRLSYIIANHSQLQEDKIAIFTPNEAFLHHIKEVLPTLGHIDIQQFTLKQFIANKTNATISDSSSNTSLKQMVTVEYGKELEKEIIQVLQREPTYKKGVTVTIEDVEITIATKQMESMMQQLEQTPLNEKLEAAKDMIRHQLQLMMTNQQLETLPICEMDTEQLTHEQRIELLHKAQSELVTKFEEEFIQYTEKLIIKTTKKVLMRTGAFDRDEFAPLLHTYFIVYGRKPLFDYVIVDEAQDYTPYEIWLLNQLCKHQNIMLVGDMGQAIQPYYQPNSWEDYRPAIENFELKTLTHTYRSTKQIVDKANEIILPISKGNFEVSKFNPRQGNEVRVESLQVDLLQSRMAYWVKQYKENGYQSFAFITMNSKQIEIDLSIPVISTKNYGKSKGSKLVVGSPLELKGLEFDVVFVDEVIPFPDSDYGKKLKYVAYTRALHQLHIFKGNKFK